MKFWIPFAFLRIVVCFIAGILTAIYFPDLFSEKMLVFALSIFVLCYAGIETINRMFNRTVVNAGFVGLPALFLAGNLNLYYHTDARQTNHIGKINDRVEFYQITLTDDAQEKNKSWKQEALVSWVYVNGQWKPYRGKALLHFSKADFHRPYAYGDELMIKGSFVPVKAPENPEEFDYRKFLGFKNIGHQHFVKGSNVSFIKNNPPSVLYQHALLVRHWAEAQLRKAVIGMREQAIALALILGIKDGLENDLVSAYSATGAMHVLAVSGLHVGILYWIILILFKPLNNVKGGRWIVAAISIFILWSYAFITGLSPSVFRAVTMFTFVAGAKPLNFRTNIYNSLAASAFCLLFFDPYLIMSVGFQLSFLAVLGIVYIQPFLYRLWEPKHKIVDKFWELNCVSMSAQLATFSLGLLYFHQFPNYFLVSNLFVIPLATIILSGGLIMLATSFFSGLATVLGIGLTALIKFLNFMIFSVQEIPFSIISNVYITAWQCGALLLSVAGLCVFFKIRQLRYLYLSTGCAVLFSLLSWMHFYNYLKKDQLTVYSVSGSSAYDLIVNGMAYTEMDFRLNNDYDKIRFHIAPNRLRAKVSQVTPLHHQPFSRKIEGGVIMIWKDKVIVQLDKPGFLLPEDLSVDYLIISRNAVKDISNVISKNTIRHLILDTSNSVSVAADLIQQFSKVKHNTVLHSVWHQGAFQKNI